MVTSLTDGPKWERQNRPQGPAFTRHNFKSKTKVSRVGTATKVEVFLSHANIQDEAHKVLRSTQTIDHIQKCFRQKF